MGDKEKALQEAGEAYEELREAVRGLDDDQSRAVWLGTWGRGRFSSTSRAGTGNWLRHSPGSSGASLRTPAGAYDDYDAWNARFVEEGKHAAHHEILADLESTHRGLLAAARRSRRRAFRHGRPGPELLDGIGPKHYREHTAQIRQWRSETGV